ncbi:MAG: UbiA-like protein EboC [Cyanobacteria bacterium P01_D01_bin.123]
MNVTTARPFSIWPYLQMARPANVVTAWADILVGYAIAGLGVVALSPEWLHPSVESLLQLQPLGWLLLATTGLYAGGVVFNDVFDAELDAKERPERPIPSGKVTRFQASVFGGLLAIGGVAAAAQVNVTSLGLAIAIALASLLYDSFSKHDTWLGPVNMGLCRGMNWLLGASALPLAVEHSWYLALIPILYIAAITAISQGEVNGGNRTTGWVALGFIAVVLASPLLLARISSFTLLGALPFVGLLAWRIIPPFWKASQSPEPEVIRSAVKAGILSLAILDAAIASGFAGSAYGLALLCLLPLSMGLARLFAVT